MVEQERFGLAVEPRGMPLELRVLRDCVSASAQLERLLGAPVIAETMLSDEVTAGVARGRWAALLSASEAEVIYARAVRLRPLDGGRPAARVVAESRLWLAVGRVPDPVVRYLTGTNLTLGQVVRLVGLPVVTRRDTWEVRPADRQAVVAFGCRVGTPVLHRRMVVLVDDELPVAVTEESFCAARRVVRRVGAQRARPGEGLAAHRR